HDANDPQAARAQIDAALASGNAAFIYTKDPNVSAFTDLMNRALDKPVEPVQLSGGNEPILLTIAERLNQARDRHRQRVLEAAKLGEPVVAELEVRVIPEASKSEMLASEKNQASQLRLPEKDDIQVRTFRPISKPREWG